MQIWRAWMDLLKRYGIVIQQSWRQRKQLESPKRQPHELQFLPAALELVETPVSPLPRVISWLLISFAMLALLWAIVGRIDIVVSAQGKIIPSERVKIIQPTETATVKAIYVKDGQSVAAGAPLIELDATAAVADVHRFENELLTAELEIARNQALFAAIESSISPQLVALTNVSSDRFKAEQRLLITQFHEYQTKLAQLNAAISQREAELASTEVQIKKLEQTVPITQQRTQDLKTLLAQHYVSKHEYLQQEQLRIEQEGDLAIQKKRLLEINAALSASYHQRSALTAEYKRMALDNLQQAEQKKLALGQELIKFKQRRKLLQLTAPVAGTVQQLVINTVGGVVTPAQPLMVIVPQDDHLEVEALVENKDIGFIYPKQDAEIKIETFPFTKYGLIHSQVIKVYNDAVNDEKLGLVYPIRLKLDKTFMQVGPKTINLVPGMAVTAEIKTGDRHIIEYFLEPLLKYKHDSLRER